jgi:hypothetical protein
LLITLLRSSEYALAKEAFDEKQARQAAVLDKIAPQQLISALAALAEALDAESEALNDRCEVLRTHTASPMLNRSRRAVIDQVICDTT